MDPHWTFLKGVAAHGANQNLNFPSPLRIRPPASDVLRARLLVLHFLLRAQPAGRRDLPRLAAVADGGRLHGPLQLGALLPGPAVQRQPQLGGGVDAPTHR